MSQYDDKDCTGWDLSDRKDMNGLTIHGLCLSNETPGAKVLPLNLKGVTFIACNLDNVFIPPGNTVRDCSTRQFEVQNDGEDWLIHPDTKMPVEPVNKQQFTELSLSIDPKDIPKEPMDLAITTEVKLAKMCIDRTIALVASGMVEVK